MFCILLESARSPLKPCHIRKASNYHSALHQVRHKLLTAIPPVFPTQCRTQKNPVIKTAKEKQTKTINSRYSLVVTHPTTNRPAHGLSTAERTGSPVFHVLWSIAETTFLIENIYLFLCWLGNTIFVLSQVLKSG